MRIAIPRLTDHGSEIGLLTVIAMGDMALMAYGHHEASVAKTQFDPSAYLVVLTLIVGAIKERWLSRSVDRMGQMVGESLPPGVPLPGAEPVDVNLAEQGGEPVKPARTRKTA